MYIALIISAITLGFLGSFHCIGMCGAIALSLPVQHLNGWKRQIGILLYNLGRICTYALLGALLGMVGNTFQFWGWQQTVSVILGALLVLSCVVAITNKRMATASFIQKNWNNKIIQIIAPLFQSKKLSHTFLIGLLNGLLPCGLVYMAIAGAVASHHALEGMLFMAVFGLGTLPSMLLIGLTGNMISIQWRTYIRKASPYIIGCMGLLLILRGANLNIPYLSPTMEQQKVNCCHR